MLRALAGSLALALLATAAGAEEPVVFGPYVPSPPAVVTRMLQIAKVGPDDFVIDLGSGDGRIPIAAAKEFGARGLGVDFDADLVALSIENAKKAGVSDRVKFLKQDLFTTDISKATVVTIYLLPEAIDLLSEKLQKELRPGTRVITHDYALVGWTWESVEELDTPEKLEISGVTRTLLFKFVIPARVQGAWKAEVPSSVGKSLRLDLTQDVQQVWGKAWLGNAPLELADGILVGEQLSFSLETAPGKKLDFKGTTKGDRIEGSVSGAASGAWSALREKKD
jgi:ubiquinone/menaquinone biosynthesis C-methylase UbiE